MSVAVAAMVLCIDMAPTAGDLAAWWVEHQDALRALTPVELAAVVSAKDRRKAELTHRRAR